MKPPVFQTARLLVRPGEEGDIDSMIRYLRANRERFADTGPGWPDEKLTPDWWRARFKSVREDFEADKALRLIAVKDGAVISMLGFTDIHRGPMQGCNLGYNIDQAHEDQGLMREALEPAIEYVFTEMNLHRIAAGYRVDNERSGGLLKRLNFRIEGHAEKFLFLNGDWRDHVLTAKINPNWKPNVA